VSDTGWRGWPGMGAGAVRQCAGSNSAISRTRMSSGNTTTWSTPRNAVRMDRGATPVRRSGSFRLMSLDGRWLPPYNDLRRGTLSIPLRRRSEQVILRGTDRQIGVGTSPSIGRWRWRLDSPGVFSAFRNRWLAPCRSVIWPILPDHDTGIVFLFGAGRGAAVCDGGFEAFCEFGGENR
jgi:hypothetical protein